MPMRLPISLYDTGLSAGSAEPLRRLTQNIKAQTSPAAIRQPARNATMTAIQLNETTSIPNPLFRSAVIVLEPNDVVLAKIVARLCFDKYEQFAYVRVLDAVGRLTGDVDRFACFY